MFLKLAACGCCALLWSIVGAADAQKSDKPQYGAWGLDIGAMDKQVLPGNDFNRYASGTWLARTQIPADKPMASLRYLMTDRTEARLHELMTKAAAAVPLEPRTLEGKVGGFYKAFMDETRVEKLGAEPIAAELKAIRAASGRDDIAELMGRNNSGLFATIFTLGTDVDLKDVTRYVLYATQGGWVYRTAIITYNPHSQSRRRPIRPMSRSCSSSLVGPNRMRAPPPWLTSKPGSPRRVGARRNSATSIKPTIQSRHGILPT